MLVLSVIRGPDQGRGWDLPDDEPQLIGRSSEALPLTDQTISRRHAELTPDDGRWYINDLDSGNGTFVNGTPVKERRLLQPGDQIRTGNTLIMFGRDARQKKKKKSPVRIAKKGELDVAIEKAVPSNDDSMILAIPEPSLAAEQHLKVIYELTQLIGSEPDRAALLNRVMDVIFEHFSSDRGFILIQDEADSKPDPAVVRHRVEPLPQQQEDAAITVSKTIIQHVMRHGEGLLSSNAMTDERFSGHDSVHRYLIRSAMCVPIKFNERLFGVIHLDSKIVNYTFTEDQLLLLTAIGVQTGLALANIEQFEQRMQQTRLAAIGETVASLSHSIKNIIQGLNSGAEVVELGLKKTKMETVKRGWDVVSRSLSRVTDLTMNMLAFSKQRQPEFEVTNIDKLLYDLLELTERQFDARKVAIITEIDESMPPIPIDASGIEQAVLNLLNNALDAVTPDDGFVTLRAAYDDENQAVRISVSDNGPGIDRDQQAKLFKPFHSTKGLRGTGLGLAVTRKIVEEHHGTVSVQSTPGEGASFILSLPATQADQTTSPGDTGTPKLPAASADDSSMDTGFGI